MTLSHLHQVKEFASLFDDPRLIAAITYLRANFPGKASATGDEWRGYYQALDNLERLRNPPVTAPDPKNRKPAYSSSRENPNL